MILKMVKEHNHELSKEAYMQYPEQRRLDKDMLEKVKGWLESGVKCRTICNHIMEQVIIMRITLFLIT